MFDGPYAYLPYGAFDLTFSLSIPPALENLLTDPSLEREWLVRALPRDESTSTVPITTIPVDISSSGYRSDPLDAEETQFIECIVNPYSVEFGLDGKLFGQALTSKVGDVIIGDASFRHRSLMKEDWQGRDLDVYLGPKNGRFSQFAKVARLVTLDKTYTRTTLNILVTTFDRLFGRLIQQNLYQGTGGLEGYANLKGKPKPLLLGKKERIEPVMLTDDNIFQIHDGAYDKLTQVQDEGIGTVFVFNQDVADIEVFDPTLGAGEFNTSLATGYGQLGSDTTGILTVGANGHASSIYGYVEDYADLVRLIVSEFGGLIDPDELDTAAFTAVELDFPGTMGTYITDEKVTILDVLGIFHNDAQGFGWVRPDKKFTIGRIKDPSTVTADFKLDAQKDELRLSPWNVESFGPIVWRVVVYYKEYGKTLSLDEADYSVLSPTVAADLGLKHRKVFAEDLSVLEQTPDARELVLYTELDLSTTAQTLADEQLALKKVPRDLLTIAPRTGLITHGIGDTFELTDEALPVSPKNFTILDVMNDAGSSGSSDKVVFQAYG